KALEDWPRHGCPANPEGWLMTVARRKAIDAVRRQSRETANEQLQAIAEDLAVAHAEELPDRRLALLFACAHPAIDRTMHAPLMLQVVLGLDAKLIAGAFLMSPAAMSKRLVRAKEKIRQAGIPFRIPGRDELAGRLETVLDGIYAAFSEGWADAGGSDAARRELSGEALFLGRLVTELLPEEPEALGLVALMLYVEARRGARRNGQGEYVPLADQDPALWDWQMIEEAESALRKASAMGRVGRYQLEAALQSAHVSRRRTGRSNWEEVVQLYDALLALTESPVVAMNRAVALAEIRGAGAGLDALEQAACDRQLREYQPYWAARAELLARTGAYAEACQAYEMAIGLERDASVRRFLQQRQSALEK
ncbi:MAG: RNA polymerase subunit sigma-70, partial [Acidobacteriia bacterium]|nr:RNA polymerase subunit sigma-70 [Terriglobia bacterium]